MEADAELSHLPLQTQLTTIRTATPCHVRRLEQRRENIQIQRIPSNRPHLLTSGAKKIARPHLKTPDGKFSWSGKMTSQKPFGESGSLGHLQACGMSHSESCTKLASTLGGRRSGGSRDFITREKGCRLSLALETATVSFIFSGRKIFFFVSAPGIPRMKRLPGGSFRDCTGKYSRSRNPRGSEEPKDSKDTTQ